jgi:hypothetical protein
VLDQAKHRSKKGVIGRYKYAKRGSTLPPGDVVGIKGLAKEQPAIALSERMPSLVKYPVDAALSFPNPTVENFALQGRTVLIWAFKPPCPDCKEACESMGYYSRDCLDVGVVLLLLFRWWRCLFRWWRC